MFMLLLGNLCVSGSVSGWIESVDHVGFVMMLLSQTLIFKVVLEWSKTVWTAEIHYICEFCYCWGRHGSKNEDDRVCCTESGDNG